MGYPTISQFDINFIKRTKENLDCKVTNNYTHLINSLLGLIVLPRQWNEQGKSDKDLFKLKVADVKELSFLFGSTTINDEYDQNKKINKLEFRHQALDEITIATLMDRLRHSIAHQSIRPTSEGAEWCGMIFRNYSGEQRAAAWGENYDLQMYVTMPELKLFVEFITNSYLKQ
jgi:hypothetical protein